MVLMCQSLINLTVSVDVKHHERTRRISEEAEMCGKLKRTLQRKRAELYCCLWCRATNKAASAT